MDKKTIYKNGYLMEACKRHYKDDFDESCYELRVLRWYRDNHLSFEDTEHYYEVSPLIIKGIDSSSNPDEIYESIYEHVIADCVEALQYGARDIAYQRYKDSENYFEEEYAKPVQEKEHVKVLKSIA